MDGMRADWSNEHASCRVVQNPELPDHMDKVREVCKVWTDPEHRREGYATELLKAVCDEADVLGIVLILQPREFGRSGGLKDLEAWYEKFGFVRTQKEPVLMARAPEFIARLKATGFASAVMLGNTRG